MTLLYDNQDEEFKMDDTDAGMPEDTSSAEDVFQAPPEEPHEEHSTRSDIVYGVVLLLMLGSLSYGLYRVYDAYFGSPVPQKVVKPESVDESALQEALSKTVESQKETNKHREEIHEMVREANQTVQEVAEEGTRRDNMIRALENQLDKQVSTQDTTKDSIRSIEDQLKSMMQDIAELKEANRVLKSDGENLMEQNVALLKEINRLQSIQQEHNAAIHLLIDKTTQRAIVKEKKPLMTYTLVAALEGRAWVEDSQHRSQTIRVGDSLKDYGRIESIDPVSGLIKTSSGRTIQARQY